MKNLILITIILLFAACQEITKDDLQGQWYSQAHIYHKENPSIEEMIFSKEKVEWVDDYFRQSGTYEIEDNELIITNKHNNEIRTKIKNFASDTLVILDSLTYRRSPSITNFEYDEYNLIGVATNDFLSQEDKDVDFEAIHYYKSKGDELKIRPNRSTITRDYKEMLLFFEGGHSMRRKVALVFIGEGITLKELKDLYVQFATVTLYRVCLATKEKGVSDYHIFKDIIEIWENEVEEYLPKIHAPRPPLPYTKKDYLLEGRKEIKIDKIEDIKVLNKLTRNDNYVISINQNMSIENYLKIKSKYKVLRRQKYKVITEIEQR